MMRILAVIFSILLLAFVPKKEVQHISSIDKKRCFANELFKNTKKFSSEETAYIKPFFNIARQAPYDLRYSISTRIYIQYEIKIVGNTLSLGCNDFLLHDNSSFFNEQDKAAYLCALENQIHLSIPVFQDLLDIEKIENDCCGEVWYFMKLFLCGG